LNARQKTASTSGSARSSYRMLLHEKREDPHIAVFGSSGKQP
jgi:hypothetical protein